ncbi:fungal-specific transcription factor domain-containing protein [Scheffersomyces xylosifermentans]|uniref:fungal-specific transcription factor domain-containing protein n=1 Tax=Scheffersomyces xylosifermentans TaxID=1304137 RepID=UPI00315D5FCD
MTPTHLGPLAQKAAASMASTVKNSASSTTVSSPSGSTKKRIRVACDHCRRKKIKCDGRLPCANCNSANEPNCHYKERPVKKKIKTIPKPVSKKDAPPKKVSKTKTIEILDTRLSTLENVIVRLTDKLEDITKVVPLNPAVPTFNAYGSSYDIRNSHGYPSATDGKPVHPNNKDCNYSSSSSSHTVENREKDQILSSDTSETDIKEDINDNNDDDMTASEIDDDEDDEEDDLQTADEDDAHTEQNNPKEVSTARSTAEPAPSKTKQLLSNRTLEQYFGTHSIMCIFSDKSLDWIERTLGDEGKDVITPIRNLPIIFFTKLKSFMLNWIDPPLVDAKCRRRLLERPFPENSKIVYDLLDTYYKDITMISMLCEEKEMREYFESYYRNFQEPNVHKRRRFRLSEYLIMTTALLLCISSKIDQETTVSHNSTPKSTSPATSKDNSGASSSMTDDQLIAMQNSLFNDAIFYYHRVSVISDGITTIEGILFLIVYIETNWITSHVNYILSTVAIRFAQEMGLHRSETYHSLSLPEQEKRRKIWWYCHYFDMEICFRSGKPPLINGSDVTTNSDEDLQEFCERNDMYKEKFPESTANKGKSMSIRMLSYIKDRDDQHMYHLYLLVLTKIRAKSYSKLFVANVQNESIESVTKTLEELNNDMFEIAENIHEDVKPRFFNDPHFRYISEAVPYRKRDSMLGVQLTYFLHLMIMNRIPSLIIADDYNDDTAIKFRNLHLDSARTILVLVRQISKDNIGISYFNWILFFPVAAFLSLSAAILNHPNLPEAYNDLKLLIDSSMNFFSSNKGAHDSKSRFKIYSKKDIVVALIIKLMLRIVIKFYEEKTQISIVEGDERLKRHLDSAKKYFPDIFKDGAEFSSRITSILGESPFSNNVNFDSPSNSSFGSGFRNLSGPSAFSSSKTLNMATAPSPHTFPAPGQSSVTDARYYPSGSNGNSPYNFSPSYNPSLSNILHPNDVGTSSQNQSFSGQQQGGFPNLNSQIPIPQQVYNNRGSTDGKNQDALINGDYLADYLNDDGITSMFYSQMNSMPNFFFDNNLGV